MIWHERETWREFEYYDPLGGAFAATYRPFKNTTIRLDNEYAHVKENRAQPWPAADRLSPWLNRRVADLADIRASRAGHGRQQLARLRLRSALGRGAGRPLRQPQFEFHTFAR